MMPLLATRGCPYQCTFCSSPAMWTTRWLARSPELVFKEMLYYVKKYNAKSFDFYDLTAIIKKSWIVEFSKLIIASGEEISWQLPTGTRCEAIDAEVADLLHRSGCKNMTYAPESGSVSELKRIKKKIKLDRMLGSMRGAVKNKLNIKANIIIGMPGQTWKEVFETFRFIIQMAVVGIHDMSINIYSCYPGSAMFDQLQEAGKVPKTLNDQYLMNLSFYTDLTRAESYSDNVSGKSLLVIRPVGLLLFYSVSFALRPWRVLRIITNQLGGIQESRLEMALNDLFKRKFLSFKFKKIASRNS